MRRWSVTYGCEGWEAQLVPEEGTEIGQVVDVEAGVDQDLGGDDVVPHVTTYVKGQNLLDEMQGSAVQVDKPGALSLGAMNLPAGGKVNAFSMKSK